MLAAGDHAPHPVLNAQRPTLNAQRSTLPMQSDLGIYRGILDEVLASQGATLSFLARDWPQIDAWRALARGKLLELLAFTPTAKPLAARTERHVSHGGLEIQEVSWEVGYGPRCQAWGPKPPG